LSIIVFIFIHSLPFFLFCFLSFLPFFLSFCAPQRSSFARFSTEAKPEASSGGSGLGIFVGLAIAGGLGYYAYQNMQTSAPKVNVETPEFMQSKLRELRKLENNGDEWTADVRLSTPFSLLFSSSLFALVLSSCFHFPLFPFQAMSHLLNELRSLEKA
jgi:hypothetical protein